MGKHVPGHSRERSFHLELPSFPNLTLLSDKDRVDTYAPKYKISVHDRDQYELKVELCMSPKEEQHYIIEVYIFMPRSLATGSRGKERFYDNLWCTMRLATPSVSLDLLSDENGPLFSALEESTDRCCREGSGPAVVDMTRQLQVLACVYQTVFKHEAKELAEAQEVEKRIPVEMLGMARKRLQGIGAALGQLRSMESTVCAPHVPQTVQGVWQELDEYVSMSAEASAIKIVKIVDKEIEKQKAVCLQYGAAPDQRSILEELCQLKQEAITESSHRRIEGYATHWSLHDSHQNETTTSRFHQLKYACQESLALSFKASAPSMFIFDTVGVFAAAASMVFAYLITMWAQRTFGTQQIGIQLLIIVTVVYVVKDRIKEWGKRYITPYLVRWFAPHQMADRRRMVRDASGRHIGWLRETYAPAVDYKHIDPMVIQVRWADTELPSDAAKNINSGMDRAAARAAALTHTAHTLVNAVATPLEGVVKQPVQWVRNVAAAGLAGISGNGSTGADDLIPLAGQGGIAGGDVEDPAEAAAAAKAARVAKEAEQGREKLKRRRHNWREAALTDGVDAAGGEYIECYRKEVDLTGDHSGEYSWSRLLRQPGHDERETKLYDCSRISISKMRHRMSAPSEKQHVLDPVTQRVVAVECARVYTFHLIIKIRHTRGRGPLAWGSEVFERAVVIADQNGIKRVQALGTLVGGFENNERGDTGEGTRDGGFGAFGEESAGLLGSRAGPRPSSPSSPRRGRTSITFGQPPPRPSRGSSPDPGMGGSRILRHLQSGLSGGGRSSPAGAPGRSHLWANSRAADMDDEETGGLRPHLGQEAPDGLGASGIRVFGGGLRSGGDDDDVTRSAAMGNRYNSFE